MRKLMLAALAAAVVLPTGAYAQSAREVRHDQREVNRDLRRGDYREASRDQHELREDWRDYRRTHRRVYNRPTYRAPRGYSYSPLAVGAALDAAFWSPRYRVSNYSHYRLPYPGRNRTWVRYGNDVVLINMRTGRIVQIYNNFYY